MRGEEFYERFIRPIEGRMMGAVWRVVRNGDDADDAFQDALAKILKRRPRIERHPNPRALILRICLNAACDVLRRRIRRHARETALGEDEQIADRSPSAPQQLASRESRARILRAVAALPRRQREALLMRALEEETYGGIAAACGCSEVTARAHVKRARDKLAAALRHLEIDVAWEGP